MDINQLVEIVKKKIIKNLNVDSVTIEDKTFLHKNHETHSKGKYHIKLIISSKELKSMNKIKSTQKIYEILKVELKNNIHSIQIKLE